MIGAKFILLNIFIFHLPRMLGLQLMEQVILVLC